MEIKEKALEALEAAADFIKDPNLPDVMKQAISKKTDLTWLDLAQIVLPVAIESVENAKVMLPATVKCQIVTSIVLPLIKGKLPWYLKPFAGKLIEWFIDVIVGALNALFTKQWGKEVVKEEEEKAEGTN